MATTTALVLNLGSITGLGMGDVDRDDASPYAKPGTITIVTDAFGYRVLKYVKFMNAVAMGDLVSLPAVVSISNITSGTTTSLVTTGLTANAHIGKLLYVLDDAGAAGAAPEGEVSIIRSNSTTAVKVETDYAFSVALAANDDLTIISNWQAEDSADGDLCTEVLGVVLGKNGISANGYGWVQMEGYCVPTTTGGAITIANPVVADAAVVGPFGSDGQELWIGTSLGTGASDQATKSLPVNLKLFTNNNLGTAP